VATGEPLLSMQCLLLVQSQPCRDRGGSGR
jgi:hypothetical protein